MNRRIEKSYELPFGYVYTVTRGATDPDSWGHYDDATQTMVLDAGLRTPAQRRYIFLHEIDHVIVEWKKWVAKHVGIENPDGPVDEPAESEEPA